MTLQMISSTSDPEMTIAQAASVCYDSKPKQLDAAQKMVRALIKSGHESCIEHAFAGFLVRGVSRVVSHELVRHRLASYCQRSQRYVSEDTPEYVVPDEIAQNGEAMKVFAEAMDSAWLAYKRLQSLGLKNEISRYVLPNACSTTIAVTMDFRSWRNFLKLRLSKRAQPEIRHLAHMVLDELVKIAPACFEDLRDESNLQNT